MSSMTMPCRAWVLVLALPALVEGGVSDSSYQDARKVLDKGLQAMGGLEALQSVKNVARNGRGTGYNQGQSLKPDGPLTTRTVEVHSFVDFAGRRAATETITVPTGAPTTRIRTVLTGDTGFGFNRVTAVLTPSTPAQVTAGKTGLRRDPAALLLTAHGRADTLRSLGEESIEGRKHQVLAFADSDGTQMDLAFDAESGLLTRIVTLGDNAILGDTRTETLFSDYRELPAGTGRVKIPAHVVTRVGGDVTLDLTYPEIQVNAGPMDELFARPANAVEVPAAPPAGAVTVTKLGEGAYLAGGGSHHSLFVAFKDHVVVVDAPLGEERSLAVLAKIAETLPGKPVRYVVPTHYHFDHSGGLRTYIAQGATVVTTPGNRAFIERLAKATRTIRPDSLTRAPRAPAIETFQGKRVFTDGTRTLELHDVGPSPHVAEMVVAYLPAEKTVFTADLLTIPLDGPFPPPAPALVEFAGKINTLGLAVETIAPAHGRVGKKVDLEAALAAKAAQ
jgi:glyoxylase-like metal-dependent hydrolase (beta-lactamase superfamily II)